MQQKPYPIDIKPARTSCCYYTSLIRPVAACFHCTPQYRNHHHHSVTTYGLHCTRAKLPHTYVIVYMTATLRKYIHLQFGNLHFAMLKMKKHTIHKKSMTSSSFCTASTSLSIHASIHRRHIISTVVHITVTLCTLSLHRQFALIHMQ